MQLVDGVILFIILISVLFGIFRGFVKETVSVVFWILAVWVAIKFCDQASIYVPSAIDSQSLRIAIAFGVLVILTLIVGAIVNQVIGLLVSKSGLSGTDRILGFIFGALRGVVIVTVLVLLATSFGNMKEKSWWESSVALPYFDSLAQQLYGYLPITVQERLNPPSGRDLENGDADSSTQDGSASGASEGILNKVSAELFERGLGFLSPDSVGKVSPEQIERALELLPRDADGNVDSALIERAMQQLESRSDGQE